MTIDVGERAPLGSPAIDDLAERFVRWFGHRGYKLSPPRSLMDADESLTFVNASMVPFKDRMANGDHISPAVQVQPCFRSAGDPPWLLAFTMLGVITTAAGLDRTTHNLAGFLRGQVPGSARMHLLVHRADADLRRACGGAFRSAERHLLEGVPGEPSSRWRYGDRRLRGRGATLVLEHFKVSPCSESCGPLHACPRFQPLGNVIVIESAAGPAYVDVGFGIECLLATWEEGDLYATQPLRGMVSRLRDQGWPDARARQLANLVRGIEALVGAGCRPGPRGGEHVLRRLIGLLNSLLHHDRAPVLELVGCAPSARKVVAEELARQDTGLSALRKQARRFVLRNRTLPDDQLRDRIRESFGLTAENAEGLLREVRAPVS